MSFQELFIKPATVDEFEFYYLLKCEPDSIYWSGFNSAPNKVRLQTWFMQKIECFDNKNSYKLFIIFAVNDGTILRVGYLSVYPSDCYENCCEIGIGISATFMGQGIGEKAIKIAGDECKKLGYRKVFAYIRKDNVRSHAVFIKAGFVSTNKKKEVYIENLNSGVAMFEYEFHGRERNA